MFLCTQEFRMIHLPETQSQSLDRFIPARPNAQPAQWRVKSESELVDFSFVGTICEDDLARAV